MGTAEVLGLKRLKIDVRPTTAHVMFPGKCSYNCSYCTQARNSTSSAEALSRITWPRYQDKEVVRLLAENQKAFKRLCIQIVDLENEKEKTIGKLEMVRGRLSIPISVEMRAGDIETVNEVFETGIDILGLPLDGATQEIFGKTNRGSFKRSLELLERAAKEHPGKISTHIIVGLGETEKDVIDLLKRLLEMNVTVGLFAFTPCKGTPLESAPQPDISSYRKIQAAHYLMRQREAHLSFDENGNIVDFGLSSEDLIGSLKPEAFKTSGCEGCNRPYYNERPSGPIYNYPRDMTEEEYEEAVRQLLEGLK